MSIGNKIAAMWAHKIDNRRKQKETAVMDTAVTSSFCCLVKKHTKTRQPSNKQVSMPMGAVAQTSKKALIPNTKFNEKARQCDLLLELQENSLITAN